jgi:anti-sigma B factor antagonist
MEIRQRIENQTLCIFSLSGRLDSKTSPQLDEKLMGAIAGGATRIILDCQNLEYISSAGLRVFNKASKKLKPLDGILLLCALADYIREVLEIAGFDTFLPILPDLEAARQSARASA